MAVPRTTGNRADEIAQQEAGADFSQVNVGGEPVAQPDIDATVRRDGPDVLITPEKLAPSTFTRDVGDFRPSAKDLVAATIFDDPNMLATHESRADLLKRKSERGRLIYYAITPSFASAPAGDRILVKRTTMESAYSCTNCKGLGHTDTLCPTCKGERVEVFHGEMEDTSLPCRSCQVIGYSNDTGVKFASGFVPCTACNSVGWAGGIVIPEVAQTEPCWGTVVSSGPLCVDYFPGDLVQYSRYCGHTNHMKNGDAFTTMREHEVLWHLKELPREHQHR
jgi:co-chaperonin GroES (HSP10)